MRITISLPRPPSVNKLYRNVPGKGRAKTREYKAWIKEAGYMLNLQTAQAPTIMGPAALRIVLNKGLCDLGNLEKATADLLQRHRLIGNDSQFVELFMKHSDTMGGNMSVTVEAA